MIRSFNFKIDWTLLFILLLPTFYIMNVDLREAQTSFFQIAVVLLVAVTHVNRYIGYFLIWVVFQHTVLKLDVDEGQLFNLFLGAVVYHFLVKFSKPSEFKKYFWVFGWLLLINCVWVVRQMYQADPIFSMHDQEVQRIFSDFSGFFGLPAFLGNFGAVVAPLAFYSSFTFLPLAFIAVYYSKSTFSAVALLSGVLFYLWFKKRIVFWVMLVVMGLSCLIYAVKVDYPTGQFDRRLKVWQIIEKLSFRQQFTGHGLGKLKDFYVFEISPSHNMIATENTGTLKQFFVKEASRTGDNQFISEVIKENDLSKVRDLFRKHEMGIEQWAQAHNEFLQVFFETGFIGVLIVIFYIVDLFKRFLKYGKKSRVVLALMSAFVGILVVSLGHFPFHLARLTGSYLVIMAFLDLSLLVCQKSSENMLSA